MGRLMIIVYNYVSTFNEWLIKSYFKTMMVIKSILIVLCTLCLGDSGSDDDNRMIYIIAAGGGGFLILLVVVIIIIVIIVATKKCSKPRYINSICILSFS